VGRVDYLALPGASQHYLYALESWNRSSGRSLVLDPVEDRLGSHAVSVDAEGRLRGVGRSLVVNSYGSRADVAGAVVTRPRPELTLYRFAGPPRLRSLAQGLFADGWSAGRLVYRSWPRPSGGTYRLVLELPRGRAARTVTLRAGAERTVHVRPGARVEVSLPAGPPLELTVDRPDYAGAGTLKPRVLGVRIAALKVQQSRADTSIEGRNA
jgi:hypothetical protein